MNRPYTSVSVFRRFLGLLATSSLKLPDTAILTIDGKTQEYTVFHMLSRSEAGPLIDESLTITSWAVVPAEPLESAGNSRVIAPEAAWHQEGNFWFGKIERVYKDTYPVHDKKLNGFGWCGNSERELAVPFFQLVGDTALFTIATDVKTLEMFQPQPQSATKLGTIDESGVLRQAGSGEGPNAIAGPGTGAFSFPPDFNVPARRIGEHTVSIAEPSGQQQRNSATSIKSAFAQEGDEQQAWKSADEQSPLVSRIKKALSFTRDQFPVKPSTTA